MSTGHVHRKHKDLRHNDQEIARFDLTHAFNLTSLASTHEERHDSLDYIFYPNEYLTATKFVESLPFPKRRELSEAYPSDHAALVGEFAFSYHPSEKIADNVISDIPEEVSKHAKRRQREEYRKQRSDKSTSRIMNAYIDE